MVQIRHFKEQIHCYHHRLEILKGSLGHEEHIPKQAAASCMTQDTAPTSQDVTSMAEKKTHRLQKFKDGNAAASMPGPSKSL